MSVDLQCSRQRAAVISVVMLKHYKYVLEDTDKDVLEDVLYRLKDSQEFIPNNSDINEIWVDPKYDGTGVEVRIRRWNQSRVCELDKKTVSKKKKKRKRSKVKFLNECYAEMAMRIGE